MLFSIYCKLNNKLNFSVVQIYCSQKKRKRKRKWELGIVCITTIVVVVLIDIILPTIIMNIILHIRDHLGGDIITYITP